MISLHVLADKVMILRSISLEWVCEQFPHQPVGTTEPPALTVTRGDLRRGRDTSFCCHSRTPGPRADDKCC